MQKIVAILFLIVAPYSIFAQPFSNRQSDPQVFKGNDISAFLSIAATDIVGFKYTSGNWVQIPIQVDEMELKDIVSGYGALAVGSQFPPSANNPKILFYCDTSTNIGADSDTTFDADDELVVMLKDAGEQYIGAGSPNGTITGTGVQILLTDPSTGNTRYVYLFKQDGSLQQNAGTSYVSYTSNVLSVAGWPAHLNGLNNENTSISSPQYSWHIAAEWKSDELKIALGTNVDILDRHKNFFADGYCGRSENTFSDAENAYLTAKVGPLRVIRSVMGANSGPLTQRTHLFYEGRFDIITNLRVH